MQFLQVQMICQEYKQYPEFKEYFMLCFVDGANTTLFPAEILKKTTFFPAEIQKQATTSDHDVHTWQQVA